jgi:hypothetical protein
MRILSENEKFLLECNYAQMESWKEEITEWFEENEQLFERSDRNPYVFYILEDAEGNYSTAWLTISPFHFEKKIVGIIELFGYSGEVVPVLHTTKPELIEFYTETLGTKLESKTLWENGKWKR